MPTARSSAEAAPGSWRAAVADTRSLLSFRLGTVRGEARRRMRLILPLPFVITGAVGVVPAFMPGAGTLQGYARDLLILVPTAATAFFFLTILSAVSSGGGRELLAREQGVAFPVSPVTDHLGALLLAPLNIAWLVQAWTFLAIMAYGVGPGGLPAGQLVVLAFLASATAAGQLIGWSVEVLRRGPYGLRLHRSLVAGVLGLGAWAVATDRAVDYLDGSPTVHLAIAGARASEGDHGYGLTVGLVLLAAFAGLAVLGVWPARAALRRMPRDEARLETGRYRPRRDLSSDLLAVARIDLASVLRSVPLRRGLLTLAVLPGLIALAGGIHWDMLVLLPGLVASGGTLLFGVNAWCLDGRGALWRASLPVGPRDLFRARVLVLTGLLLVASATTVVLGSLRAGQPTAAALVALVCAWVVVCVQVVGASMAWSLRRPFAVDLRSARATPAPPVVMLGYSAKLAVSTTVVGLLFSALAVTPYWWLAPLGAVPLLGWSVVRLRSVGRAWADDDVRSQIVVTVAA